MRVEGWIRMRCGIEGALGSVDEHRSYIEREVTYSNALRQSMHPCCGLGLLVDGMSAPLIEHARERGDLAEGSAVLAGIQRLRGDPLR